MATNPDIKKAAAEFIELEVAWDALQRQKTSIENQLLDNTSRRQACTKKLEELVGGNRPRVVVGVEGSAHCVVVERNAPDENYQFKPRTIVTSVEVW